MGSFMPEAPVTQRSKGMRDLLPDEMERLRAVESAFAAACRAWGYREIRTPLIEPLHLFTAAGTLSPHTLDGVYSFLDWDGWSGERVVLRPDSTIPAARLYAEHLAAGEIAKLFYTQTVYRFAGDDSDREEEQCGVELIGATGSHGDVELIQLALATLAEAGVSGEIALHLSHTGIARSVMAAAGLSADEQMAAYDRLLDGDLTVIDEVEARLPKLNTPLRMLFEVTGQGAAFLANLREPLSGAIPGLAAPLDELTFVIDALQSSSVQPRIEAVLARNFEYYSGVVFKIYVNGQRVITGGRYDGLLELVSGRAVPASGFGLYVQPTAAALVSPSEIAAGRRVAIVAAGGDAAAIGRAYALAATLRGRGLRVETIAEGDGGDLVEVPTGGEYRLRSGSAVRSFKNEGELIAALEAGR
jgi:histidyl-tRNA synthetase